ncbi:MAG: cation:proton antiporter [SAR324 cluster bacterium]|jgi:CPA2 family monovalent cation:H+ antiporter-2|nr:cation:proton antiporter [SAR324 cluster bacterium]|tara:strand:+ start:1227 stop:3131 length:1905 start_codon:yes stop_codon:yes gene_type:complete
MSKSLIYRLPLVLAIGLFVSMPAYAGGGGWFIKPLGLMLGGAMILTILLIKLKQTNILSFVIMGYVMASVAGLPETSLDQLDQHYSGIRAILSGFQQIGLVLILFMAGLQFNLIDITKRFKLILVNGVGYLGLGLLLFFWAAAQFAGTEGFSESIYFALCLAVPSSILVAAALENSGTEESLQGQISTGIAVVSSLCAIVFIAKLSATGVVSQISDSSTFFSEADNFMEFNLWMTERLVFLVVILMILSKLVLEPVVRYLLRSSELLFVSALGYCMGIAAICGYIGISPEAGAFFAGISVGNLPYRLDIEDKVGPLKLFGQILFFLTVGVEIATIQAENFSSNLGAIIPLLLLVVLIKPFFLIITGYASKLKGRTAFLIGTTVNQSSAISIIVALLAWKYNVFNDRLFAILIAVILASLVLSSMGHAIQPALYQTFKWLVGVLNRNISALDLESSKQVVLKNHVVLLGFNEIAQEISEFCDVQLTPERVLLIDCDPDIIKHFEDRKDSNVDPVYADPNDPKVWQEYKLSAAKVVVSCMGSDLEADIQLASYIKRTSPDLPFLAVTTSHEDSLKLYESGARYVIQTEQLASKTFRGVFAEEIDKPAAESFLEKGGNHWKDTRSIRDGLGEIFKLV